MMRDEPPQRQEQVAAAQKITSAKGIMRRTNAVFMTTERITATRNTKRRRMVKTHSMMSQRHILTPSDPPMY